ncbi:zinc finger, C4 type [Ostertagia ostertagi]
MITGCLGISEGIRYLNGSDSNPHSPPSVGLGISPPGRSTSPGFDSSAEKPICRVCGDKAFSYNFNVITCESCKAFFRRNANKEREIRCPFNEQCEINVVSRRFCQRCRLAKCFDVGMKKEWIMSDEARLEKKQRVEENRERRMADAMARAETIDDDDTQNDSDVAERMRQRAVQTQEINPQYDVSKNETRLEETQPVIRPPEDLYSLNPPPEHAAVPIVVPPLLEAGSTAGLDVSSTTTAAPTMDVDPATTMSSSGFIPPAVESGLLVMPASNPVDPSFMAQAQLAAAAAAQVQVQAAINQHQIAAAVAQQVAAHIVNAAPVAAPVPAPIAPALNQPPILAPAPATSLLLTPSLNPITPMTDMVTIPREVLVKLIENNPPRVNCTCQCTCGRYPPGCAIVDEVTKDLLAAGNNLHAETSREEAKLESTEDFHMNGLLPSEESSVQWLNACAPTVDPSAVVDERPSGRRDSFYMNSGMVDTRINSVPAPTNLNGLSPSDHVTINEVLTANHAYKTCPDSSDQSRHDDMGLQQINFTDGCVRRFVRMLKRLSCFSLFSTYDRCILIRKSCIPYMIIHNAISYDPKDPKFLGQSLDVRLSDVLPHCISNENVMLIFGLLVVFDAETIGLQDRDGVSRQFSFYSSLLQRLLYSLGGNDSVRSSADYRHLLDRLNAVGEVASHAVTMSHELDSTDVERLLHEFLE